MKQWFFRAAQIALGAIFGSLLLGNLTNLAVLWLVPKIHDVQFVALIFIISSLGGIFGAVSSVAALLARAQRFKSAGWLALVFGILGLAVLGSSVLHAERAFADNGRPLVDALAYFGFTLAWSLVLAVWGIFLLFKKSRKAL